MLNLKKELIKRLEKASKIAILGIGSELRGDDIAGLLALQTLEASYRKSAQAIEIGFFFGATAPENLTGEIKKFNPSHILIIDAAHLDELPGSVRIIPEVDMSGISFSTHRIPTKILVDYLLSSIQCKAIVIGIQPKSIDFGVSPSKEVRLAAKRLAVAIKDSILKINKRP